MKRSLILLTATAAALVFGACDQHSWEEGHGAQPPAKDVFKPHHGHGGGHGDGHGDDHAKEGHADEGKKEDKH